MHKFSTPIILKIPLRREAVPTEEALETRHGFFNIFFWKKSEKNMVDMEVFSPLRSRPVRYNGVVYGSAEMLAKSLCFSDPNNLAVSSSKMRAMLCKDDPRFDGGAFFDEAAISCILNGALVRVVCSNERVCRRLKLRRLDNAVSPCRDPRSNVFASCSSLALQLSQHPLLFKNLMRARRRVLRVQSEEAFFTLADVVATVVAYAASFQSRRGFVRDARRVLRSVRLHYLIGRRFTDDDIGRLARAAKERRGQLARRRAEGAVERSEGTGGKNDDDTQCDFDCNQVEGLEDLVKHKINRTNSDEDSLCQDGKKDVDGVDRDECNR